MIQVNCSGNKIKTRWYWKCWMLFINLWYFLSGIQGKLSISGFSNSFVSGKFCILFLNSSII